MGLKLVMACSADGYLCRNSDDDMSWTGHEDKALFRLLTMSGGVLGAGSRTYDLLPRLPNRRVIHLSTHDGGEDCSDGHRMSLGMFAHRFPGAWLVGGPTIAYEALNVRLVDEVHLVHSKGVLLSGGVDVNELTTRAGRYMEEVSAVPFAHNIVYQWRRKS